MVDIGNDWDEILKNDFESAWYKDLRNFLISEYSEYEIYPDKYDIFNAIKLTPYSDTKVVILGQDPYHNPKEAHGLCFSVKPNVKIPPSLLNIYKELQTDIGTYVPDNGYLKSWAEEGVLLLNTVLTVRRGSPLSHKNKGWERLTDDIISKLNDRAEPVIFMLWGNNARSKKSLITNNRHLVLEAAHPSPLSAYYGFFGCRHFSKANRMLIENGKKPIDWQIGNL